MLGGIATPPMNIVQKKAINYEFRLKQSQKDERSSEKSWSSEVKKILLKDQEKGKAGK